MDYYEELGLNPSASADQIRQAYRILARLLHPDQQLDPDLRRLAELQMKRANGMLAVLTDAEERRRYDASRAQTVASVPAQPRTRRLAGWAGTIAAAAALAGFLFRGGLQPRPRAAAPQVLAAQSTRPPPERALARMRPRSREPDPDAALAGELVQTRRQLRVLRGDYEEALHQIATLRARGAEPLPPMVPAGPLPSLDLGALDEPPTRPPASSRPAASPRPRTRFGGDWFYVRPAIEKDQPGLYPPEYIELRIVEDGRMLRGRYQARYKVADRAISPEVLFQFEGARQEGEVTLAWTGSGGARGTVHLKLGSPNSLIVEWSARRISQDLSLVSGTATLVRRVD